MFKNKEKINNLVTLQLKNYFGNTYDFLDYQDRALTRLKFCFESSSNKYYHYTETSFFNVYNTVQYSLYLYYLANTIYLCEGENEKSEQLYYLNKALNCVDWFYQIKLPNIFGAEHPMSSVMGRGTYSDYFFFYQGCTIGGNGGKYPQLGNRVIMYSNSSILGNSCIGNNVILGANTLVIDTNIPNNCIVFGQGKNLVIKEKSPQYILEKTLQFWKE